MTPRATPTIALTLAALVIAAAACGGDSGGGGRESGAVCPQGSTLTYASFGQAFFSTYCLGCHGDPPAQGVPEGHQFDTLAGIQAFAEHIDEVAAAGPSRTNTHMPPAGNAAPSVEERQQLGEWLACGAPAGAL